MQRVQDIALRRLPRLSLLCAVLAAVGAAAAAQQAPADGVAGGKHGGAHTTYRVIHLAAGPLASIPDINAKGQVAFSIQAGPGGAGYFYNGSTVQQIGSLGGVDVRTADLNNLGQVTGTADTALDVDHAFVWSPTGGMLDISAFGGAGYSTALAINNHGVVTGGVQYGGVRVMRWSPSSVLENLGALSPDGAATAYGWVINDAGLIAGSSSTVNNSRQAFSWTRSTGMINIDTLNSYDALVSVVGPRGEVAGNRLPSRTDTVYRGFLYTPATGMVDLGNGGGVTAGVGAMTACLQITGNVLYADDSTRGYWWTRSTGIRTIGTLGGASSRAFDINAGGQIVGWAHDKADARRAFVWSKQKGMLDLNRYLRHAPPGLVLDDALAINDGGAIVATSNAGLVLLRPDHGFKGGHVLGPLDAPALVKAGAPLKASASFVDPDRVGVRSVNWLWGEGGSAQAGRVSESAGVQSSSASHSFATPGIYPVTFTVVDRSGRSTAVGHEVVVTAAAGGAVAGAGSVLSPLGAVKRAPSLAGKARFSLIAPLTASARAGGVPARLHFDLPGLNLRSQDLRLVGRQGGVHRFEGSARVHGVNGYKFSLSMSATVPGAGQGRFALKVWHTDPTSKKETVEYDSTGASSGTQAASMTEGGIVAE